MPRKEKYNGGRLLYYKSQNKKDRLCFNYLKPFVDKDRQTSTNTLYTSSFTPFSFARF